MIQKYIGPGSVEDWIQDHVKLHTGGSIFWRAVVKYLDVIEANIAWHVGNGRNIIFGEDAWVGCIQQHKLRVEMVMELRHRGIFFLNHLATPL